MLMETRAQLHCVRINVIIYDPKKNKVLAN